MSSSQQGPTLGSAVSQLLENSSAHGLPNIHRSKSLFAKCAWTALFLASVTVLSVQVVSLLQTYLAFGYTVSLDVRFDRSLAFPAVTVCNTNPVRKAELARASDAFRELFDVDFAPPKPKPKPHEEEDGDGGEGDHAPADNGDGPQAAGPETARTDPPPPPPNPAATDQGPKTTVMAPQHGLQTTVMAPQRGPQTTVVAPQHGPQTTVTANKQQHDQQATETMTPQHGPRSTTAQGTLSPQDQAARVDTTTQSPNLTTAEVKQIRFVGLQGGCIAFEMVVLTMRKSFSYIDISRAWL